MKYNKCFLVPMYDQWGDLYYELREVAPTKDELVRGVLHVTDYKPFVLEEDDDTAT